MFISSILSNVSIAFDETLTLNAEMGNRGILEQQNGLDACFNDFFFFNAVKSFLVVYCDRVLKTLPDVKTLISLHQQLLVGVVTGCGLSIDKLGPSDQLRNAGMSNSCATFLIHTV